MVHGINTRIKKNSGRGVRAPWTPPLGTLLYLSIFLYRMVNIVFLSFSGIRGSTGQLSNCGIDNEQHNSCCCAVRYLSQLLVDDNTDNRIRFHVAALENNKIVF